MGKPETEDLNLDKRASRSLTLGELAPFQWIGTHKSILRTNRPVSLSDTAWAAKYFVTLEVGCQLATKDNARFQNRTVWKHALAI
jgi:hypothetical protein